MGIKQKLIKKLDGKSGSVVGGAAGTLIGTAVCPGIGTVVGAAVGTLVGFGIGVINAARLEARQDKQAKQQEAANDANFGEVAMPGNRKVDTTIKLRRCFTAPISFRKRKAANEDKVEQEALTARAVMKA